MLGATIKGGQDSHDRPIGRRNPRIIVGVLVERRSSVRKRESMELRNSGGNLIKCEGKGGWLEVWGAVCKLGTKKILEKCTHIVPIS